MFLSWSVLRVTSAAPVDRWTVPQLIPSAMHLVVAVLFLNRDRWTRQGDFASILWSLPSFVVGGLTINLAQSPHQWPWTAQLLFTLGAVGAVTGLLFLGPSFAIFPSIRRIVNNGPFQYIRHPIYLAELVMIAACCVACSNTLIWLLFLMGIFAIVIRISFEEKILRQSAEYLSYCSLVRFRLIPGIW